MPRSLKDCLKSMSLYTYYLRAVKRYRAFLLCTVYPGVYRRYAKRPVDSRKVLFFEAYKKELSDSFLLVYDALEKDGGYDLRSYCLPCMSGMLRFRQWKCLRALKDLATARALFINIGYEWLSHVPIRKETAVVQLWHGCGAFKRFGMSVGGLKFGHSTKEMKEYPVYANYTLVTVSSPEVVWAYAEAMDYPEDSGVIQATGVSRTDVFFDESFLRAAKERLLAAVPQAQAKRVLLYAPTFRGHVGYAESPTVLDIEKLRPAVEEDSILLVKHHPFVKRRPPIPESCRDFAFDVTDTMTIEDLLCVSDVCISDYSSLVFEYSLFERPMIFLAHDIEDYCDWRGFYYDYETFVPGPIVKTTDELIEVLTHPDEHIDLERVRAFKQKFMSACDGHATERILDRIGLVKAGRGDASRPPASSPAAAE